MVDGVNVRRVTFGLFFILSVAMFGNVDAANSENDPRCPYQISLLPSPVCGPNSSPHPMPQALGGSKMTPASCVAVFNDAIASMYAYDNSACYSTGGPPPNKGKNVLKFVEDAANYLPRFSGPCSTK